MNTINTTDEFKEIVEGKYGILDLSSYEKYKIQRSAEKGGISTEEIEHMSPDNVNSCSFWEYIAKNPELAKDAVAFGATKDTPIKLVNSNNFSLACGSGTLNFVFMWRNQSLPILDIGAGYGMLKEFVEKETRLKYYGVDVYPKVEGVYKVAEDGFTMPDEIMKQEYLVVVATNVFQHLSVKQRQGYYRQIESILHPSGTFSVSMIAEISDAAMKGFLCKETGRRYACHYGQYTEIQTPDEIWKDLTKHFIVHSIHQKLFDSYVTYNCQKKPSASSVIS